MKFHGNLPRPGKAESRDHSLGADSGGVSSQPSPDKIVNFLPLLTRPIRSRHLHPDTPSCPAMSKFGALIMGPAGAGKVRDPSLRQYQQCTS